MKNVKVLNSYICKSDNYLEIGSIILGMMKKLIIVESFVIFMDTSEVFQNSLGYFRFMCNEKANPLVSHIVDKSTNNMLEICLLRFFFHFQFHDFHCFKNLYVSIHSYSRVSRFEYLITKFLFDCEFLIL